MAKVDKEHRDQLLQSCSDRQVGFDQKSVWTVF